MTDSPLPAYTSDETGREEIYLRPYPDLDSGKWRVSLDGGRDAKWGRDPAVLHFTSDSFSTLNTVRLQLEPRFEVLERQAMDVAIPAFACLPNYAVGQSDDEFLIIRGAAEESTADAADNSASSRLAVLVDNFFAELNQKAPPNPQ